MLFGLLTLLASATFAGGPPSQCAWPVPVIAFDAAPPAATSDADPDEEKPESIDYWSMLFVFTLSTFIGMGVIGRVSRLLHTPLMSLTNAISAIAIVGSIMVTGQQRLSAGDPHPGRDCAVCLDDEHCQRLPDHRPDAEDVSPDPPLRERRGTEWRPSSPASPSSPTRP